LDTHAEQGLQIDGATAATRWRGERMDYGLAIQVLLQQAGHVQQDERVRCRGAAHDVSAETSDHERDEDDEDDEHDAEWRRRDEEGTSLLRLHLKSSFVKSAIDQP
jgi:hypothetical protein